MTTTATTMVKSEKSLLPRIIKLMNVSARAYLFEFSIYLVSFNRSDEIMISRFRIAFFTDGSKTKTEMNGDTFKIVRNSFSVSKIFHSFNSFRILVSRHVTFHHYLFFLAHLSFAVRVKKFIFFFFHLSILCRVRSTNIYHIEFLHRADASFSTHLSFSHTFFTMQNSKYPP